MVMGTGCKKFLDQEVPGRLTEESYYKTDQDALEANAAIYDLMQAHYNSQWVSMYMVKTLLSDESNAGGSGPGDQEAYQALDNFNHDADNAAVLGTWRISYATIYRANKVINNVIPENDLRKRLADSIETAFELLGRLFVPGSLTLVTPLVLLATCARLAAAR